MALRSIHKNTSSYICTGNDPVFTLSLMGKFQRTLSLFASVEMLRATTPPYWTSSLPRPMTLTDDIKWPSFLGENVSPIPHWPTQRGTNNLNRKRLFRVGPPNVGPTQFGAALNEKHTFRIYLTWGLFKIKGNMQYGLCGTSCHGAKIKRDTRYIPAQRGLT